MSRPGILSRILLLATAVASIAVVVAGLVSLPLIRSNAQAIAADDLSRLADLTASSLRVDREGRYVVPQRVGSVLLAEGVTAYVVSTGATDLPAGVDDADVAAVTAGESVQRTADTVDGTVLIAGRAYEPGTGVILVQSASVAGSSAGDILVRLAIALFIGLAIAVIIAVVASVRIITPLRRAADAAHRLGSGDRNVHVNPEGPAEIADIAEALNQLSAALAVSEGRQREFLLSVSHELRTPITSVRGYAEALADGLVAPEDVPRTGAVVAAETQRLDRLVSDLLDLARLRADNFTVSPVEVDARSLLTEAAGVWADRCERVDVRLVTEMSAQAVPVLADPLRLRQIIDNLAENALRLVPTGGVIVFAVRAEDRWGVIEVRDSGPGLSAADLDVAFEPGILHERYRGIRQVGTGLGLALVGRLSQEMAGFAQAGVAPEGGAAFTVRVPRSGANPTNG